MPRPGWNAKGLLQPLWTQYPGGRDALAQAIGTTGAALSSRNSGRVSLGDDLATRLVAELSDKLDRDVSVLELGAPDSVAEGAGRSVLDRLEALATQADEGRRMVIANLEAIDDRLSRIERSLGLREPQAYEAPGV